MWKCVAAIVNDLLRCWDEWTNTAAPDGGRLHLPAPPARPSWVGQQCVCVCTMVTVGVHRPPTAAVRSVYTAGESHSVHSRVIHARTCCRVVWSAGRPAVCTVERRVLLQRRHQFSVLYRRMLLAWEPQCVT